MPSPRSNPDSSSSRRSESLDEPGARPRARLGSGCGKGSEEALLLTLLAVPDLWDMASGPWPSSQRCCARASLPVPSGQRVGVAAVVPRTVWDRLGVNPQVSWPNREGRASLTGLFCGSHLLRLQSKEVTGGRDGLGPLQAWTHLHSGLSLGWKGPFSLNGGGSLRRERSLCIVTCAASCSQ